MNRAVQQPITAVRSVEEGLFPRARALVVRRDQRSRLRVGARSERAVAADRPHGVVGAEKACPGREEHPYRRVRRKGHLRGFDQRLLPGQIRLEDA